LTRLSAIRILGTWTHRERITIKSDKLGGKPCIGGLWITVADVLGYMASAMSQKRSSATSRT
jgi:uncharacterized protein (DUF433 family)